MVGCLDTRAKDLQNQYFSICVSYKRQICGRWVVYHRFEEPQILILTYIFIIPSEAVLCCLKLNVLGVFTEIGVDFQTFFKIISHAPMSYSKLHIWCKFRQNHFCDLDARAGHTDVFFK